MHTPIVVGIVIVVLVVLYFIFQGAWKKKGSDKLINQNKGPLEPDSNKPGGGTPRDTYPGKNHPSDA